jgi:hypothetical protein
MRMLPIGPNEAAELEVADADAISVIVQAFAVGSGLWDRVRSTTATPTQDAEESVLEDVPWYVARTADVTLATSLTGEQVAVEPYTWVSPGNYDLREGDVMRNQSDQRLRY